jgi:hypothetical protein
MAFQSTLSRLAGVAFILLSLGFLVRASPIALAPGSEVATIEERADKYCYGKDCYGGLDLVTLLLQLQAAIEVKLKFLGTSILRTFTLDVLTNILDGCLSGGDYKAIIIDIEGLLYAAIGAIKGYKIGLIGLLTGKLLIIAKIWFAIVIVSSNALLCTRSS